MVTHNVEFFTKDPFGLFSHFKQCQTSFPTVFGQKPTKRKLLNFDSKLWVNLWKNPIRLPLNLTLYKGS